jgi:hypothetical protein
MIYKLWRVIGMLFNRDYIPPLPRGMLATAYEELTEDERRVMARHGARDPNGVKVAMRRAGVTTADELVSQLEHYTPARRIKERVHRAIGRVVGGTDYEPHEKEIRRVGSAFQARQIRATKEIVDRVKRTRKAFRELDQ